MFTSKIIKLDDDGKSTVQSYFLKKLPEDDNGDSPKGRGLSGKPQKGTREAEMLEAERLRVQAAQEAKLILDQARQQAKQIEKEAYQSGFAAGETAGRRSVEDGFNSSLTALGAIASEFAKIKQEFYEEHQDIILELAIKIARKVIHQEVKSNPELIIGVLKAAIKLTVDREKIKARISPRDLETCQSRRAEIGRDIDGVKQIIFEADENISRGGTIVEYSFGEIDARLEQQILEIESELRSSGENQGE